MIDALISLGFCILGYLFGSLPFALWITRLIKGVDVREAGSGHISTTNTIRQVGWVPGVLVLVLDMGKGFLPTFLADHLSPFDWVVPITAALALPVTVGRSLRNLGVGWVWRLLAGAYLLFSLLELY